MRFERVDGKKWPEVSAEGRVRQYVEAQRNADFVELHRADGLRVRLHATIFYWDGFSRDGAYVWKENPREEDARGGWKTP
jgi:hypothetical protein